MNIARKKATGIALMIASAMMGAFGFTLVGTAQAASEYDPGFLIADGNMYTAPKMSADEIQQFLNDKGRYCQNGGGAICLKDFKMKTASYPADNYCPNGYVSEGVETAAQIIYKAAKACNIAPEVILVTLQKEQSLITNPGSSWAYKATMGFNCPDDSPCATADFGFQHQVYRGARQFQVYRLAPGYFNYRGQGTFWVGYHPNTSCGGANIYMKTQATASLYNYTPYQPNGTVLENGYVASNMCGTYGNYNFVNYYRKWFGDPKVVRSATQPTPKPAPAKPVKDPKANETGTKDNLDKEKTGPTKPVAPVSKPTATAVPTIESAVVANTKIAAESTILPNTVISFELVNLKPNQKPFVTLNGRTVENPGVANAEGELTVKVNTGTGPDLTFAIQDNGKEVGLFKAKVVAEVNESKDSPKGAEGETEVKSVGSKDSPKGVEGETDVKLKPMVEAITVSGQAVAKNQQLRAGDEIALRITGVSQDDLKNEATELYFHSPEKVLITKHGKWENNAYVISLRVPEKLSNGKHGIFISINGKETKLYDFTVNNPIPNKAVPVNIGNFGKTAVGSNQTLAQTGAEAGVVFMIALMLLVGGVYLVIGAQQNKPIRVNC